MKKLILASGSQSRREILSTTGYPFSVEPSNYEEDMTLKMSPADLAVFLSVGKARDVAKRHNDAVILAADSFAVFDEKLLGKPHTKERAVEMLSMLSGKCHSFVTGFTIIDAENKNEYSESVESKVCFKDLTPVQIDAYIESDDVLDKAGAYTVQGPGSDRIISRIEGDENNVMGLPLERVKLALRGFGIDLNSTKN